VYFITYNAGSRAVRQKTACTCREAAQAQKVHYERAGNSHFFYMLHLPAAHALLLILDPLAFCTFLSIFLNFIATRPPTVRPGPVEGPNGLYVARGTPSWFDKLTTNEFSLCKATVKRKML
jgi:hypothetical protein